MPKINSRSKGQRAERELVKKFSAWWGSEFFRTPGSGSLATIGFKFKDIEIHGDISTPDSSFPFCVESKHHEGWSLEQLWNEKNIIEKWWAQASKAAEGCNKQPLLVFKKNRGPYYVMLITDKLFSAPHMSFCKDNTKTILLLEDFMKTSKEQWL